MCVVEERSTIPFAYDKKIESNLRTRREADGEIKLNVLEKSEPPFPVSTTKKRPRSSTVTTWSQEAPETDNVYDIWSDNKRI